METNNRGLNAYAVVHPVLRQTPVSAKNADIKRAFFAFVDADEKGAADRVRESKLFIAEREVVTGTKPFWRNQNSNRMNNFEIIFSRSSLSSFLNSSSVT